MQTYTKTNNQELIEYLEQRDDDGQLIREYDSSRGTEGLLSFARDENNLVYGGFRVYDRLYILFRRVSNLDLEKDKEPRSIFSSLRFYDLKAKGFCGVADDKGVVIIPAQYAFIEPFMNDILLFRNVGFKSGLMRLSGEIVVEPVYTRIDYHKESLFAAIKDEKVGFLDFKGEVVIPFEYDVIEGPCYFANGLACVAKKDTIGHHKFGYINHKNEIILPFIFRNKVDFDNTDTIENEERVVVQYEGYSPGYLDKTYLISIDGSMVVIFEDDSNEIKMEEWEIKHWNPYPNHDDNDPLDAYEGDESNRWNTN